MSSWVGVALSRGLLVLVVVGGLLWPLLGSLFTDEGSPADDPVVISEYRATFDVDEAGELDAVEDITAVFPSSRHGIFRYWDVADAADPDLWLTGMAMVHKREFYEAPETHQAPPVVEF